jgi:hypothetical protein
MMMSRAYPLERSPYPRGCREALGKSLAFGWCRQQLRTAVVYLIGGVVEELRSHPRVVVMATLGIITGGGHIR